jgi:hypothetical protein
MVCLQGILLYTTEIMGKYVDRILDEVDFNFERHFDDFEERQEFLEELIEALQDVLNRLEDEEEL